MEIKIPCLGYELAADWYEGHDASRILLVLPGYSSSKARQKMHAEAMVQDTGASALVIDFSGHGNSPFELRDTSPAQHFLELVHVFDWVQRQYPSTKMSVSASSYGGFLAVLLTQYRNFANLVLRAPAIYKPASFYDLWATRIDHQETHTKDMLEYRTDAKALAKHPAMHRPAIFTGRTLVVVHQNDEIVPHQTTDAYISALNADSLVADGFSHTIDAVVHDPAKLQEYHDRIATWLNQS